MRWSCESNKIGAWTEMLLNLLWMVYISLMDLA